MPDIMPDTTIILGLFALWTTIFIMNRLFNLKELGIDVGPFILMYRTNRISILDKITEKIPAWIWNIVWTAGILLGFAGMACILGLLAKNFLTFFQKPSEAAPTIILIPGLTISLRTLPYILISIAVVVLSHELSHGISAKREGIGLKSVGLLLFLVIPGAFVEPEEEDLKKVPLKSRLRVYGAGSLSNMIVAALTLLLFLNFTFLISPLYVPQSQGVLIIDVVKGGPSEGILFPGAVIFEINGTRINNLEEFSEYLSKIIPGQILVLKTNQGDSIIKTGVHPSNKQVAYLGVYPFNYYPSREYFQWMGPFIPYHVYWTFYWTWFVCLNIALFNLLPLFPLDGDKMFMEAAGYLTKDKDLKRLLTNFMRSLSLFLLLGNFALTFLNMGFITI